DVRRRALRVHAARRHATHRGWIGDPAGGVISEPAGDRGGPQPPAVSVIIPAYKTAPFIGETLASVVAQTFQDFEIIVVNDGSPDTVELERVIEPYRERITYVVQENRGLSAARNAGIA